MPPRIPDFAMLRRVGGGSYGDVWIARSLTGIYRAVKVVDRARFKDERPFLRELDGITRFQMAMGDRPRQLALLHVGRDDEHGFFYYVMELADDAEAGTDINPDTYTPLTAKELHLRNRSLPVAECVRIGVSLAEALVEMHAAGLIHRDVKPSNIIFVGGVPKLADIGLVSSSDQTMTSLGTPGYAPPEGAGTPQADVYSLGKILYELSTGLDPESFPRLPADVSERADADALLELNDVFLKACEPVSTARYQSAQALLDDLRLIQAGKSVRDLSRLRERLRVLRRWLGIAAVVAVAGFGALGWLNLRTVSRLAEQEGRARQQAETDERLSRYSADLQLASLTAAQGDLGLARAALRRQIPTGESPDLRGVEWHALWHDTAGDARTVWGEVGQAPVRATVASLDGRWVAVERTDGAGQVIEIASGRTIDLPGPVQGLAGFSADSRRVIFGSPTPTLRIWDPATRQLVDETPLPGRLLRGSRENAIVLVAQQTGAEYRFMRWDVGTARILSTYTPVVRGADFRIGSVAFSPDGARVAIDAQWTDGVRPAYDTRVWDSGSGDERSLATGLANVRSLAFSPSGRLLGAGMSNGPAAVIDVATGRPLQVLAGGQRPVLSVAFSPDEQALLSAGSDQLVRIYGGAGFAEGAVLKGHEGGVAYAQWTAGLGPVTGAEDGTVRRWSWPEAAHGRSLTGFWDKLLGDQLLSPNGQELWITERSGRLARVDLATGAVVSRTEAFQPLAFTASGKALLALSADRALVRVDLAGGAPQRLGPVVDGSRRLSKVVVSPDRRLAVLGSEEGETEVWDLANEAVLWRRRAEKRGLVWAAAFSPSGERLVVGDNEGRLWLWLVNRSGPPIELPRQPARVVSLWWPAGGDTVAVGLGTGPIVLLDTKTHQPLRTLTGHSAQVYGLTSTRDGRRLISGGGDGLINFWDLPSGRLMASLPVQTAQERKGRSPSVYTLRMPDDESLLSVMTQDGQVRWWRLK